MANEYDNENPNARNYTSYQESSEMITAKLAIIGGTLLLYLGYSAYLKYFPRENHEKNIPVIKNQDRIEDVKRSLEIKLKE